MARKKIEFFFSFVCSYFFLGLREPKYTHSQVKDSTLVLQGEKALPLGNLKTPLLHENLIEPAANSVPSYAMIRELEVEDCFVREKTKKKKNRGFFSFFFLSGFSKCCSKSVVFKKCSSSTFIM